jgi:hypothetical protein
MQLDSNIRSLGYIQFKTHCVHISKDLDRDSFVCFKSTGSRCDIDSFSDYEEAVDYILAPLPSLVYYIDWGPDSEQ